MWGLRDYAIPRTALVYVAMMHVHLSRYYITCCMPIYLEISGYFYDHVMLRYCHTLSYLYRSTPSLSLSLSVYLSHSLSLSPPPPLNMTVIDICMTKSEIAIIARYAKILSYIIILSLYLFLSPPLSLSLYT